jgi:hypothetical protein
MSITYRKTGAVFTEFIAVDEAEPLLEWLQKRKSAKIDFGECTHVHASVVQVLLAAGAQVSVWPQDEDLKMWLQGLFETKK